MSIEGTKILIRRLRLLALAVGVLRQGALIAAGPAKPQPPFRVAELKVGESRDIELANGKPATVKSPGVEETRDRPRSAIRLAKVKVDVNGVVATSKWGNYRLPGTVGTVLVGKAAHRVRPAQHDARC